MELQMVTLDRCHPDNSVQTTLTRPTDYCPFRDSDYRMLTATIVHLANEARTTARCELICQSATRPQTWWRLLVAVVLATCLRFICTQIYRRCNNVLLLTTVLSLHVLINKPVCDTVMDRRWVTDITCNTYASSHARPIGLLCLPNCANNTGLATETAYWIYK